MSFNTHKWMIAMSPLSAALYSALLFAADPAAAADQVRATVQRSLPFIQTEGQRWIDDKKCVSCHQVPFMVWALNAAADRGFDVEQQKRQDCGEFATDWKNIVPKTLHDKGERPGLAGQPDAVYQLLLGRSVQDRKAAASWPTLFVECLAAGQQVDGSWKAGGQLPSQKRPERETTEVTTMWALAALQSYAAADESLSAKIEKSRKWLGNQTEGESTEWWAVRLLLERTAQNVAEAERIRDVLLMRQHDDGGWGWISADESDALGTGLALYALARDGLAPDHSALVKGRAFLTGTQQANGSWPVKGTKKVKSKQVEPTATYWGTCWAVIALVDSLPPSSRAE
jgi:squalene-hopene/tetraprenyl-beta-curcumene cyclase